MVGEIFVRNPWILATASTVAMAGAHDAQAARAPYSWTGFYIGANLGATAHEATTQDLNGWGGIGTPPYISPWFKSNKTAASFGGNVGYSWQMSYLVVGVEADISYVGSSNTFVPPNNLVIAGCGSCLASATNELTWLSTFRGRAGIAVDRLLFFATAGVAVGQVENRWGWGAPGFDFSDSQFRVNSTQVGYVVGGGIEAMITPNVSVRFEAMHVDLGTSRRTITGTPNCCAPSGTFTTEFKNTADIGRFGLTYRW
jgi:outer membrane immunogenic protein